jgi:hypothetical protein
MVEIGAATVPAIVAFLCATFIRRAMSRLFVAHGAVVHGVVSSWLIREWIYVWGNRPQPKVDIAVRELATGY